MRLTALLLFVTQLAFGQAHLILGLSRNTESISPPVDESYILYDNNVSDPDNVYTGSNWGHFPKATNYLGTQSVNTTTNEYFERTFVGHKVEWWSEKYPWHGISEISIDGVVVTNVASGLVDQYAVAEEPTQLLYTSPTLSEGSHTIKIRVTGTKNAGNVEPGKNYLVHDFLKVYYTGAPTPPVDGDYEVDTDAELTAALATATAGQVIIVRAGTYRNTYTPANSGTAGNPITIKAYTGETVIISGLNTLSTSWSVDNGNVYKTLATLPRTGHSSSLTSNTSLLANQIFQNGTMQFEASTRNITTINDLFDKTKWKALTTANFQPTTATDAIFNGKSLSGATAVIQGWFAVDSRTINAHTSNGNTIGYPAYADNSGSGMQYRRWIYVSNDRDLLDQAMEWHYDGTYLYLWQTGGGSPTGTIEYKARNWGFDLRGRAYINIEDITFKGCEPVTGNDNTNYCTLDNVSATYMNHSVAHQAYRWQGVGMTRQMGTKLTGVGNTIIDSDFSYASTQGIWIGANGRVENCYIHHIGYDGGWGAGIDLWGEDQVNNIVITHNTISHTSRSSVSLGYAFTEFTNLRCLNLDISYNDFSEWCLFSDDGGAIYTWGFRDHTGSVVHHNWFHDAGFVVNPLNLPGTNVLDGIQTAFYTDQGAGPFIVHHNVFWNNVENFSTDAADVYTQPTFAGGGGGYRNNGGSKFYNNTFYSNSPWTGKSNPYNSPAEPFRNNIIRKTWTYYPSGTIELGSESSNTYNNSPVPTFNGGSLATPEIYFGLQSGSAAVNRGIVISGITGTVVGAPDTGAYERGITPWTAGYTP